MMFPLFLIVNWFGTIWLFSVPNIKKQLAGRQYWPDDEVISAVEDFFEDQDESFYTMESKRCNTDGRTVWTVGGGGGETMLKNIVWRLVKFDHCVIGSLWTFQPTLINSIVFTTISRKYIDSLHARSLQTLSWKV